MDRAIKDLKEKEVQELITDFPWLLNLDYENIPQLKNKGMEYRLSESKRADLILRDRRTGKPVIVEFKAVPFYRESIGQILEYKARVINEYSNETSILREIFENKMFSPIMVLVVPHYTAEAALACNLSGIDIYEYDKTISEFVHPEKRKTLEEFIKSINTGDIPFAPERSTYVNAVYEEIRDLLNELDLMKEWEAYKNPPGEYLSEMNRLFINKSLFSNNEICIGIYEDVFSDNVLDEITIEYYSRNKEPLNKFVSIYKEREPSLVYCNEVVEEYRQFFWNIKLNKKEFLDDVKGTLRPIILSYLDIMKNSLKLID